MLVVIQDLSHHENKPKKVFECKGYKFAVVNYPYQYMNAGNTFNMLGVFEYGTGRKMPIQGSHRQTLKSLVAQSINTINQIYADFGKEKFEEQINQYEIINN